MKTMHTLKTLGRLTRAAARRAPWRLWPRIVPAREVPDRSALAVDVQALIASLDSQELRAHADAYFSGMTLASPQCRKPFMGPAESVHLCSQLGLLFEAAALFRYADVLDFGCGTGWLTTALARQGCNATGLDISPAAVNLARRVAERELDKAGGSATFAVYDGMSLPFADATFDRVVCFDAFHHVIDQRATIAELARVLRPGGRIAFVEPGPHHSTTPQSQHEMLQFRVIENDVSISAIAQYAAESGLKPPEMLVQFQRPVRMPVDQFARWTTQGVGSHEARRLVQGLISVMTDGQCFYLCKGDERHDSRQPEGLRAHLTLIEATRDVDRRLLRFRMAIRNDGFAHWLCTERRCGEVRLGVMKIGADGRVLQQDYARFSLPVDEVAPGAAVEVSGSVRLPADTSAAYSLRFDLVSRRVAWFAQQSPHTAVDWSPAGAG
jgi:SAM-dependent methyltransferase